MKTRGFLLLIAAVLLGSFSTAHALVARESAAACRPPDGTTMISDDGAPTHAPCPVTITTAPKSVLVVGAALAEAESTLLPRLQLKVGNTWQPVVWQCETRRTTHPRMLIGTVVAPTPGAGTFVSSELWKAARSRRSEPSSSPAWTRGSRTTSAIRGRRRP